MLIEHDRIIKFIIEASCYIKAYNKKYISIF